MSSYRFSIIHSAVLRLTLFYIAAIAVLSVGFSVFVYELSSQELERPAHYSAKESILNRTFYTDQLDEYLISRAHDSLHNLRSNLILFNVVIISAGAVLSYWFARRTLKPVDSAMEQQGRFAADASHELRTPLTVMQSEIEIGLRNKQLTLDEAKALLASNLEEVERLGNLSNGLLKLAKTGTEELQKTPVNLQSIAERAITQLQPKIAKKGTVIKNDIGGAVKVLGDTQSLQDLVTILLDNAIKYSPDGATVALDALSHGKQIQLVVRDNGQGIASKDLPHIFDRFYRTDSSRTKQHVEGYGLGLSIAKRIVDMHDADIAVTSKPGKGSTFIVTLQAA